MSALLKGAAGLKVSSATDAITICQVLSAGGVAALTFYGATRRPAPFICCTCPCGVQWLNFAPSARWGAGAGVTPWGHASGHYRDPLTTGTPPSPLIGNSKGVPSEVPARGTRRHSKFHSYVSRTGKAAKQLIVTSGTLTS